MDDLITEIDAFMAKHSMKPCTFGRLAVKDHHIVTNIRNGREPRRSTEQRIRQFMKSYDAEKVAA